MERYGEARTALEFEPKKRTTLFYLGLLEVEEENWLAAVDKFERVVRVEPRFALGHVFLARSLAESGRLDDAREAHRRARDLYVTNLGANVLLENDGTGRFEDVTARAGVGDPSWSTAATFLDLDNDADLVVEQTCNDVSARTRGRPDARRRLEGISGIRREATTKQVGVCGRALRVVAGAPLAALRPTYPGDFATAPCEEHTGDH